MKRAHRFAPGVIECPDRPSLMDKLSRVLMVASFLIALAVVGGQIYKHLMAEIFGI